MATNRSAGSHEDFAPKAAVRASSDRSFGLVFAAVFAIVAAWPLFSGGALRLWALAVAAGFALAALAFPAVLAPLNRAWMRVGMAMHAVVSPVVLSIMYFGVVWPTGAVMRLMRRDLLRLEFDREAASYWVDRKPPGPPPESFRDPF